MADSLIFSLCYRLHLCRGDGRTRTGDRGFADLCLDQLGYVAPGYSRAEDEIRTRDPLLGKEMLYR